MGEIRRDPILNRWVVYASERGKRPHQIKPEPTKINTKTCFFCPGQEDKTPPEIGRIEEKGDWKVRWFENKFSIVNLAAKREMTMAEPWWIHSDNFGHHEVIVETNDHNKQLWDLSLQELLWVFSVYKQRITKIESVQGVEYVQVFKNHGGKAGTSVLHSHSQVVGLPFIPPTILEEVELVEFGAECPFCKLAKLEEKGPRKCFSNEHFVAFTPYASEYAYETWVIPKKHHKRLDDIGAMLDLALIVQKVLTAYKKLNLSYNMILHYAPNKRDHHVHLRFLPRTNIWAGFELGTHLIVNPVYPEDAAQAIRETQ